MKEGKFSSQGGFSLLEVMAAVAVLGLLVTGLLELASSGLRLARSVDQRMALASAADEALSKALAGEKELPSAGNIECAVEESLFVKKDGPRPGMVSMKVTATDRSTGSSLVLTMLKER